LVEFFENMTSGEYEADFAIRTGRNGIMTLDDLRKKYPGGLAGFSGGRGLVRSDNRDRVEGRQAFLNQAAITRTA
jgi:hypothetical protein